MGLDVYLQDGSTEIDRWGDDAPKSPTHPDHLCTPFYLRSSYNSNGFDGVVGNIIPGGTLWDIFAPCGDLESGRVRPTKKALRASREKAIAIVEALADAEAIGAEFYADNPFRTEPSAVDSDEAAIAVYRKQKHDKERPTGLDLTNFGNIDGEFYLGEPLEVIAVIPGKGFGRTGVYLVYKMTDLAWYQAAAEIVVEFIDNALSMKRPVISWSY